MAPGARVSHAYLQPADVLQAAKVSAERVRFHLRNEADVRRYLRQDMVAAKDRLRLGVVEAEMPRRMARGLDRFVHPVAEAHGSFPQQRHLRLRRHPQDEALHMLRQLFQHGLRHAVPGKQGEDERRHRLIAAPQELHLPPAGNGKGTLIC